MPKKEKRNKVVTNMYPGIMIIETNPSPTQPQAGYLSHSLSKTTSGAVANSDPPQTPSPHRYLPSTQT